MWKKLVGIIKFTSRPSVAASNTSIYSHSEILILFATRGVVVLNIFGAHVFFSQLSGLLIRSRITNFPYCCVLSCQSEAAQQEHAVQVVTFAQTQL